MRTFVIGDVHGHYDRLVNLIARAGAAAKDVQIVQLGDLGHFGADTQDGDRRCYELAQAGKFIVLWGNHDRAVVDPVHHKFRGYVPPGPQMQDLIEGMVRPLNAYAADGYLLTHAGLHPAWSAKPMLHSLSAEGWASLLNDMPYDASVLCDIGPVRGGSKRRGGIFWRDAREALYSGVQQVFGHTRGMVREYPCGTGRSFCIDTGDKTNGSLVGMWLDTGKIVAVGPDAEQYENYPPVDGSTFGFNH
jgi:hypothetical protein